MALQDFLNRFKQNYQQAKPKALSTLSFIGDQLSRGNYASANITRVLQDKPQNTFMDKFKMMNSPVFYGKDMLKAGYRGATLQDKTTYSDVLDKAGMKPGLARTALGFGMDVAFDPTTYLTLGTGTGAKIATKGGTKVLTRAGTKQFSRMAGNLGRDFAEQSMANVVEKSPSLAGRFVDKGGIKFVGQTIPGTDKIVPAITKGIVKIPYAEKVGDFLGSAFNRDYGIKDNPIFQRVQQKYRDVVEAGTNRYASGYQQAFRGLSKQERELITDAIDAGTINKLDLKLQSAANFAKREFEDILKQEKGRGLTKTALENYVTHIYEDPAQAKKLLQSMSNAPSVKFAKERVIPTLKEAEEMGLKPIKDIQEILAKRRGASLSATAKSDFLKEVGKTQGINLKETVEKTIPKNIEANKVVQTDIFGGTAPKLPGTEKVVQDIPGGIPPGYTTLPGVKELNNKAIPADVAQYITNMGQNAIKSEPVRKVLSLYDKAMNFWKGSVTTAFPSFHTRNAASNILQNYLDVGLVQSLNPKFHNTVLKVIKTGNADEIVKIAGRDYRIGDLRRIMQDNGVLQGRGMMDVGGQVSKVNLGRRAGRFIENEARGVNFLANLERSGDVLTSAERTKKFLFDYDNLSDFEKSVMKRIFPFYTWTAKNLALQAEQLIKQPGKFANQFKLARDVSKPLSEADMALLPDYMKDRFVVKTGEDKAGNPQYRYSFGTPIENFTQTISNPLRAGVSMLSPAIKAPLELATGQDFFYGKPIKEVTDAKDVSLLPSFMKKMIGYEEREKTNRKGETYKTSTANPYVLYALRQTPLSRFASTSGKIMDTKKDVTQRVLDTLTGVKTASVDLEQQAYFKGKDAKKELANKLVQRGLLKEGEFGTYYLPSNVKMSESEREEAIAVKTLLNKTSEQEVFSMVSGVTPPEDKSLAGMDTEIEKEIAKDKFKRSDKNFADMGNYVLRKNVNGEVSVVSKDEYQKDLYTAQLANYKKNENYEAWKKTADEKYQVLQKQLQDPNIDELDRIKIQNEIDTLEADYIKFASYGGFTKPKKGKKVSISAISGHPNFGRVKAPSMNIRKPQIKAPKTNSTASLAAKLARGR